ncbi:hypothetical protein F4778DRAFT_781558 [Xylariomycetidae sp. FL2044]|nr:hypothetical protein F4778DRAFT_781558 [Xylariomycetidae sp. FL2044]
MAAWSDGTNVVSSFREAANQDDNPAEVTDTFSVQPIASRTSAKSSFSTFTRSFGSSTAVLNLHDVGFGGFDAHLDVAKTPDSDTFATLAGKPLVPSTGAQPISANAVEEDDDDDDDDDEGAAGGAGSSGGRWG